MKRKETREHLPINKLPPLLRSHPRKLSQPPTLTTVGQQHETQSLPVGRAETRAIRPVLLLLLLLLQLVTRRCCCCPIIIPMRQLSVIGRRCVLVMVEPQSTVVRIITNRWVRSLQDSLADVFHDFSRTHLRM